MALPVRAIYVHGVLQLLDPVDLDEGQQVTIQIETETVTDQDEDPLEKVIGIFDDPITDLSTTVRITY